MSLRWLMTMQLLVANQYKLLRVIDIVYLCWIQSRAAKEIKFFFFPLMTAGSHEKAIQS